MICSVDNAYLVGIVEWKRNSWIDLWSRRKGY